MMILNHFVLILFLRFRIPIFLIINNLLEQVYYYLALGMDEARIGMGISQFMACPME